MYVLCHMLPIFMPQSHDPLFQIKLIGVYDIAFSVSYSTVEVIVENLPDRYVDKLLERLSQYIESSPHVQYYTMWSLHVLTLHGPAIKHRSRQLVSVCTSLHKSLTHKHEQLRKMWVFMMTLYIHVTAMCGIDFYIIWIQCFKPDVSRAMLYLDR